MLLLKLQRINSNDIVCKTEYKFFFARRPLFQSSSIRLSSKISQVHHQGLSLSVHGTPLPLKGIAECFTGALGDSSAQGVNSCPPDLDDWLV